MTNVKELSRIEFDNDTGLYLVKILSSTTGKWITVAECTSEQHAKIEKKMFSGS